MNQPLVDHDWSQVAGSGHWAGRFFGTWDLNSTLAQLLRVPVADMQTPSLPCDVRGQWHLLVDVTQATPAIGDPWVASIDPSGSITWTQASRPDVRRRAWPAPSNGGRHHLVDDHGEPVATLRHRSGAQACSGIEWLDSREWWCHEGLCPTAVAPLPSYFAVSWGPDPHNASRRLLRNELRTSAQYPWLMLYTGADAATCTTTCVDKGRMCCLVQVESRVFHVVSEDDAGTEGNPLQVYSGTRQCDCVIKRLSPVKLLIGT